MSQTSSEQSQAAQAATVNLAAQVNKLAARAGQEASKLPPITQRVVNLENTPHGDIVDSLPTDPEELAAFIAQYPHGAVILNRGEMSGSGSAEDFAVLEERLAAVESKNSEQDTAIQNAASAASAAQSTANSKWTAVNASTSQRGIVQLSSSTSSTSTATAATSSAVKAAYDKASEAMTVASGATVIETWKSDDGKSWYRKWSDGWIEQGGLYTHTSEAIEATITLATPYSNTNYFVTVILHHASANTGALSLGINSKTASSFHARMSTTSSTCPTQPRAWYACGY